MYNRCGGMQYDAEITNPHLPQMKLLNVLMALVNPARIAFAVTENR